MDQLIAKVTNFGYELLGIFVPGAIAMLFGLFWWWCLGPMADAVFFGYVPRAELKQISDLIGLINEEVRLGMVAGLLVAAYFIGHALHWIARSGKPEESIQWHRRVWRCLRFSVPRPLYSYDPKLEKLLPEAKEYLGLPADATWREYYPVAKAYLSQNLQSSLVSTYQNKYTLHRSVTAAAAVWFWLSLASIALGMLLDNQEPKWIPLAASLVVSLFVVWGFSDSYRYNWGLFGDTTITEIYMLSRSRQHGR